MADRSTRCISQVFGFLKEQEYCANCHMENTVIKPSHVLVTKSVSDTKLVESALRNDPSVVRKCPCQLKILTSDAKCDEEALQGSHCNGINGFASDDGIHREGGGLDEISPNTEEFNSSKLQNFCNNGQPKADEHLSGSVITHHSDTSHTSGDCGEINPTDSSKCLGTDKDSSQESPVEKRDDVLMRRSSSKKNPGRTNTQVVSDLFTFLNTDSLEESSTDTLLKMRTMDKIEEFSDKVAEMGKKGNKSENVVDEDSETSVSMVNGIEHSSEHSDFVQNQNGCATTFNIKRVNELTDIQHVEKSNCENVVSETCNLKEVPEILESVVNGNGCDLSSEHRITSSDPGIIVDGTATSEVTEIHGHVLNESEEQKRESEEAGDIINACESSDQIAEGCETGESERDNPVGVNAVMLRDKRSVRKSNVDDSDNDSSDEDAGIYDQSFRNSTWIRIDDEKKDSTTKLTDVDDDIVAINIPLADEVFTEGKGVSLILPTHKRSHSTTTTLSEIEFKQQYTSRRKCLVQRQDSQHEYHRMSERFYDQEQVVSIEKPKGEMDKGFGLHILDSHPAYITSVDPGSPAEKSGVQEGHILVAVNGVNVLEAKHDEILALMQQNASMVKLEFASSDYQPVRDLQAAVRSGYMYKLGNSALLKMWKKRFFVLRQDNCLYYYKNEHEQIPLGAVPLNGYSISRYTDTNRDYCFKADKYGARCYYFMTDNRTEMTDWVGDLSEAASRSKAKKDSWLNVSSHNVGLPALEIRRPESSGFLSKMGNQRKVWRRRYCVLKDACIYYYKLMSSHSAQGVAHLHGYTVDASGLPGKRHSFILVPPETCMRTFYFCAENETDKKRWVTTMNSSIQRWVKVEK